MKIKPWYVGFAVIAIGGCGGGGGGGGSSNGPPPPPTGNTPVQTGGISVTNNAFNPSSKVVAPGTTIQWSWNSCTTSGGYEGDICVAHSVTFDDGVGSAIQERGTFSRTFSAAGTYDYHCQTHGSAMTGRVTVQ